MTLEPSTSCLELNGLPGLLDGLYSVCFFEGDDRPQVATHLWLDDRAFKAHVHQRLDGFCLERGQG